VPPIRTAIVGATGYSGIELATILLRHPAAEIVALFGSSARAEGTAFPDVAPALRARLPLTVNAADPSAIARSRPEAVFLCTPHEASLELAPELRRHGLVVFDLSGAFRLKDRALYPRHYGFEHTEPDLLSAAVYGLPELHRSAIAKADLVAVPGCYPTSAILPLAPVVRAGAVRPGTRPIVDAISGVSGAGRTPGPKTHFCEVSVQPYNVLQHRHNPEIDAYAGATGGVVFTPHLGPYQRGIVATIHVELGDGWSGARARQTLEAAYGKEPFIRLLAPDQWPSTGAVERTNFCDIGLAADDARRHLIVVSAIDNLTKGAAGQAVQCMNIRFGLPETAALL
jgi:N-acetyl-gamma-glutamyl-phosphate reductase